MENRNGLIILKNPLTIYSNLNNLSLDEKMQQIEGINKKFHFLKGVENLVIYARDLARLYEMGELIVKALMPNYETIKEKSEPWAHHGIPESKDMIYLVNTDSNSPIKLAYGRCKGVDSTIEKLSRSFSKTGKLFIPDDYNGITLVTETEEDTLKVKKDVDALGFLIEQSSDDYLTTPKTNGIGDYRALHSNYYEKNGNPKLNGTKLEIHYETLSDMMYNKTGGLNWITQHPNVWKSLVKNHPQSCEKIVQNIAWFDETKAKHKEYGELKLSDAHNLPDKTLIVGFDNKANINPSNRRYVSPQELVVYSVGCTHAPKVIVIKKELVH